jgi:hypothetical protein
VIRLFKPDAKEPLTTLTTSLQRLAHQVGACSARPSPPSWTPFRTPRNVSDQLGHSQTAMPQNKYMGRQITDTGAADILEALAF